MTSRTEKYALSYISTNDARVDLFFKTTTFRPKDRFDVKKEDMDILYELINKSWNVNELDTFKIIMNWRDIKFGKGEKMGPIVALLFISENYKEWFIRNFKVIPEYGCWLDLIKIWHFSKYLDIRNLILQYIADTLKDDIHKLNNNENISLLAKWLPSENSEFDRLKNTKKNPRFIISLCKLLMDTVDPDNSEDDSVKNKHIKIYRTEYLVPLRRRINIVETLLCKKLPIKFEQVPSMAMIKYKNAFHRKYTEDFAEYIKNVKTNKSKINTSTLYPHDVVKQYIINDTVCDEVVEEQWRAIKQNYVFNDVIAVCDVSNSMTGLPILISIAMGLLCLCDNKVITFSEIPELHEVPDDTLFNQVQRIKSMQWGNNTDFEKVMDLVLSLCKTKIIRKVFIFSDMQFDEAMGIKNDTHINIVKKKFDDQNIEMPLIIFWNLRNNTSDFPVKCNENNIIMLSGASPKLLNFLKDETYTPLSYVLSIIHSSRYDLIKSPDDESDVTTNHTT